ncbi:MAG TPA: HNH endonuclease [Chloroflexi bacterium]|nr:HNH endonuclease [Chloroflexota bacterium]
MKSRKYTDEQLEKAVKTSHSISAVLKKIGLTPAGGNYESIKKRIQKLNLDTSHFLGQAILRGKTHTYNTRPLEEVLVHKKLENTWRLKNRLLREGIKAYQCERCGSTEWLGHPIPLEFHHKDGDRTNNTLQNIELLCPNCHSMTDNYRGSKKKV